MEKTYIKDKDMKLEAMSTEKCPKCGANLDIGTLNDFGGKKSKTVYCEKCGYKHATPITKESLDEAKTSEEIKMFNKYEKEAAKALGIDLPLTKETPRKVRNQLYSVVARKMTKSNVSKVMEALMEASSVKYDLTPLEQKKLKKVAEITKLSFHALASRPETARGMINRVLGEDVEELDETKYSVRIEYRDSSKNVSVTSNGKNPTEVLNKMKKKYPEYKNIHVLELDESLNEGTVTIEKSQGEYRVPAKDGYEDGAAYTDDKDDAIATAKRVFGKDVEIKFRSVPEFVGGKYEKYRPKGKLKEGTDDWKYIYSKCPKCGSKDIKCISMDEKGCNSCKHKWKK
jgi:hypothetical protein